MKKLALLIALLTMLTLMPAGCGRTGGVPDPDKIVPARETLIENLKSKGYAIEELESVEGSELTVDRVLAKKGNDFIDIVYGLSSEEAQAVYELFEKAYPDNYYVLARNGNYVYCVSDRATFKRAGFRSTENIGVQHING